MCLLSLTHMLSLARAHSLINNKIAPLNHFPKSTTFHSRWRLRCARCHMKPWYLFLRWGSNLAERTSFGEARSYELNSIVLLDLATRMYFSFSRKSCGWKYFFWEVKKVPSPPSNLQHSAYSCLCLWHFSLWFWSYFGWGVALAETTRSTPWRERLGAHRCVPPPHGASRLVF